MGTVVGFLLGYVFGTKAGGDAINELKGSLAMITGSGEVQGVLATGMEAVKSTMAMVGGNSGELQGLIAGGLTAARGLVSSGGGMLAARMAA